MRFQHEEPIFPKINFSFVLSMEDVINTNLPQKLVIIGDARPNPIHIDNFSCFVSAHAQLLLYARTCESMTVLYIYCKETLP